MPRSKQSPLLVHPKETSEYHRLTPEDAGWEVLHFGARTMERGEQWSHETGEHELAIVVLGGRISVRASCGTWPDIGRRRDVFSGMPHALYLPRHVGFVVEAESGTADIAYGSCNAETDRQPRLITPAEVTYEIRGKGNATRQINDVIPPGFDCDRLVVVEVYTPSGNWSSYPPHKHDVHRVNAHGEILEADLEEVYFYKSDKPKGYAYQRVYSNDGSLDELVRAENNDVVLVPRGYHPVVSAHGYTTYYLNFLAGSAQSLANADDPDFEWIKNTWSDMAPDPRLPIVSLDMETSG